MHHFEGQELEQIHYLEACIQICPISVPYFTFRKL
jgi:hypothetical protein